MGDHGNASARPTILPSPGGRAAVARALPVHLNSYINPLVYVRTVRVRVCVCVRGCAIPMGIQTATHAKFHEMANVYNILKKYQKIKLSEMGLPGGRNVPIPRGSILHPTRASQLPYNPKIDFC